MKSFLWKFWKIFRWVLLGILILFVLLLLLAEGYDRYIASQRGAMWLYSDVPTKQKRLKRTPSGVRYLSLGDPDKPGLVLIHGAPGGLFDWKKFASKEELYQQYRLLIVERPGYGGSKPRGVEKSIKIQAEKILEVIASEKHPVEIVGHSYGAPVAVVMGAFQPDKIKRIIAVSGQFDPDNEIVFGISHFINFGIFRFILPRLIWVSNEEKLSHQEALKEIIPLYSQVEVPVVLIHGNSDSLVPYENSPYLMEFLNDNSKMVTLEGYDHPLQMQEADYLARFVLGDETPPPSID